MMAWQAGRVTSVTLSLSPDRAESVAGSSAGATSMELLVAMSLGLGIGAAAQRESTASVPVGGTPLISAADALKPVPRLPDGRIDLGVQRNTVVAEA